MKALRVICMLAVLLPALVWGPQHTLASTKPHGISQPSSGPNSPASGSFQFIDLKTSANLWSDGHGDDVIEQTVLNNYINGFTSFTWCYDWPSASYWNISAYDGAGPLAVSTYWNSSTQECVTAYFRSDIPVGASYHFSIAVSIGGMASGSQASWEATWYTQPGGDVGHFQESVSFPSSAAFTGISPTPTSQIGNTLEWDLYNTTSGDSISIDVFYTLSDHMNILALLQGKLPLKNNDPVWENDLYAWNKLGSDGTIYNYGCYMTDAAMLVNYWAQQEGIAFQTDPRQLNTWLQANQGYDGDNLVLNPKVVEYAKVKGKGVRIHFDGLSGVNNALLDQYLISGRPVILGVDQRYDPIKKLYYAGHYVLATGKTTVSGTPTYWINDPLVGATTLLAQHRNTYLSMSLYSNDGADNRALRVAAHSPVELMLTDSLGRRTGYDATTGNILNEIPGADYGLQGIYPADGIASPLTSMVLNVYTPLDGNYQVAIVGTGTGSYTVDAFGTNWNGGTSAWSVTGTADPGLQVTSVITYSSYTGLVTNVLFLPFAAR